MLSHLFHKKTRAQKILIPEDRNQWPQSWKTIQYKEYPRFPQTPLPSKELSSTSLNTALERRRSSRSFNTDSNLTLEELAQLLQYSAGMRNATGISGDNSEKGLNESRYYPSAGARYPLEVYVLVQRISDIEMGAYHYNVRQHGLELLLDTTRFQHILDCFPQKWCKDGAALFLVTAAQERNAIKYGDSGYGMLLLEAGHLSQNLHLVAEVLEKKYCPVYGLKSKNIHKLLHLDEDELVLYATIVGN